MSTSTLDHYRIASFELMHRKKFTDPSSTAKDLFVTRNVSECRLANAGVDL